MSTAAIQALKKFRLHEFKGLQRHILRFGPLQDNSLSTTLRLPNPFVARKNPKTGRWIEPKYSLRRQADLVKKAKAAGLLHLLPPGPKSPAGASRVDEASTAMETETGAAETLENNSASQEMWAVQIEWEGSRDHKVVLGTRLYAGKKRMFKGHKWERVKAKRETHRRILLRDMDRRVHNYKNFHKRRRPHPLRPPRTAKAPKLPF